MNDFMLDLFSRKTTYIFILIVVVVVRHYMHHGFLASIVSTIRPF